MTSHPTKSNGTKTRYSGLEKWGHFMIQWQFTGGPIGSQWKETSTKPLSINMGIQSERHLKLRFSSTETEFRTDMVVESMFGFRDQFLAIPKTVRLP